MISITEERRRLATAGLTVRRREAWGSRFDYTAPRPVTTPAARLILHITVTNPSRYRTDDAHARAVEAIGISRFPRTGGSYNTLLMPGGRLFELQPLGRRGAHTLNDRRVSSCVTPGCPSRRRPLTAPGWNLNVNSRALALARDVTDPVTDTDVLAAAQWGAALILTGLADPTARWHGHRCAAPKDCPGDRGFTRLPQIQALTSRLVTAGTITPPHPEEPDMPLTPDDLDALARAVWSHPVFNRLDPSPQATIAAHRALANTHRYAHDAAAGTSTPQALADALAPLLAGLVTTITDADLDRIAAAVLDELARRAAA